MRFKLPKRTTFLWQLRIAPAVILFLAVAHFCKGTADWLFIGFLTLAAVTLLFMFVFLPLFIKSYEISANEASVTVKRGVIIKTVHIMPYPKTVFVRGVKTPLSSKFRLEAVSLKAVRASLFVLEMRKSDAEMLLSRVWEQIK